MRKEYIEYPHNLPVRVQYLSIESIPLHWKRALTLVWVLEGELELIVETEKYQVHRREVEVINVNEVFAMEGSPDNRILLMEVNPGFFLKYYEDAGDTFFYTNAPDDDIEDERYQLLRKYMARLAYEFYEEADGYEEEIEDQLRQLMFHLLNHFHYLYYDEGRLKEDEERLARYHRIVKYLSNNYMNQVQLADLADKEYLSKSYLSTQIKETFGQGFKEYLNQIRVEEATKLLLDTDLNISRISEEVGFSHVRYFNQYFKRHYKMTPREYRKAYSLTDEEVEELTKVKVLPLKEGISQVYPQLVDWPRFFRESGILRLNLNLDQEAIGSFIRPQVVDMGKASLWLEEDNRVLFTDMQRAIGFKYGLIRQLFSDDMDIYRGKNRRFINWTRVEGILEFFADQKLIPLIDTSQVEAYILEDFRESFLDLYEEEVIDQWLGQSLEELGCQPLPLVQSEVYDRMLAVPLAVTGAVKEGRPYVFEAVDMISRDIELNNDTFFGGPGLCTSNFLKKPLYYGMSFLALMGDEVVHQGDNYLMTKKDDEFQLLLFNGPAPVYESGRYQWETSLEKKININLYNLPESYTITRYDLNEQDGSIYDKWKKLGSPERIPQRQWELFAQYVHPRVSVGYAPKAGVFNLVATLKDSALILYEFTPS